VASPPIATNASRELVYSDLDNAEIANLAFVVPIDGLLGVLSSAFRFASDLTLAPGQSLVIQTLVYKETSSDVGVFKLTGLEIEFLISSSKSRGTVVRGLKSGSLVPLGINALDRILIYTTVITDNIVEPITFTGFLEGGLFIVDQSNI